MHVLFVTECRFDKSVCGDGSTRYRCFNVAEALIASGHRATVASLSEVPLSGLQRYDVISVLRPRSTRRLARLLKTARAHGIHLVADFDDLIFDVAAAAVSPLVLNGFASAEKVVSRYKSFAKACTWFDEITVSTRPLVTAAKKCFPSMPVYLLANGLSLLWLKHAGTERPALKHNAVGSGKTICYLPGTRSHDADFRAIEVAVQGWLSGGTERRLRIVGELNVDDRKFATGQLIKEPLVPYFELPEKIQESKVTLAPLTDSVFNQAKSHIKFLESAAFGVPVVASINADIEQHLGVTGLFCPSTSDQWQADINAALDSADQTEVRQQLSAYVRKHWIATETSRDTLQRWYAASQTRATYTNKGSVTTLFTHPDTFFSSLRPVPHYYSRNGWQSSKPTCLLVFESNSDPEFNRPEFEWVKERVTATGAFHDQWLILVSANTSLPARRGWIKAIQQWRSESVYIEVLHAVTFADRCSLLYQSDVVIWLTAEVEKEKPTWQRTHTKAETLRLTYDRWERKLRKLRESPTRFFAESKIARLANF